MTCVADACSNPLTNSSGQVLPLAYEYYADSVSNMADSLQQLIDASPSATKTALNPMMPRLEAEIAKFANASHYVELVSSGSCGTLFSCCPIT